MINVRNQVLKHLNFQLKKSFHLLILFRLTLNNGKEVDFQIMAPKVSCFFFLLAKGVRVMFRSLAFLPYNHRIPKK